MKTNTWKITIENEDGSYSVEANVISLDDVMETLVRPVLLAAGLGEEWVDEYIYGNEDSETVELKVRDIMLEHQKHRGELRARLQYVLAQCDADERGNGLLLPHIRSKLVRIIEDFF